MFLKTHSPLTERLFMVSVFPVMAVNVTLNTTVTLQPFKSCLIAINICLKGGLTMSTPNFMLTIKLPPGAYNSWLHLLNELSISYDVIWLLFLRDKVLYNRSWCSLHLLSYNTSFPLFQFGLLIPVVPCTKLWGPDLCTYLHPLSA